MDAKGAAQLEKAIKIAEVVDQLGYAVVVTQEGTNLFSADQWAAIAAEAGVNSPSEETLGVVAKLLGAAARKASEPSPFKGLPR